MSQFTVDAVWPELCQALTLLLKDVQISPKQYMACFTSVYNHCTRGPRMGVTAGATYVGEELYEKLKKFLEEWNGNLMKGSQGKVDDALLKYYAEEWKRYYLCVSRILNNICSYLNKNWVKNAADQKKEVYDVGTMALLTWRAKVFEPLSNQITIAILRLIQKERNGEKIETDLVKGIIESFVLLSTANLIKKKDEKTILDIYKEKFEDDFLTETEVFYTTESSQFLMMNTPTDYMIKVEGRLQQEVSRVNTYLHDSTLKSLITRCEAVLISKHKEVITGEFQKLLENDKVDDLQRMYGLLSRITDGLDPMRNGFEEHVYKVGAERVELISNSNIPPPDQPKAYVDGLLEVYKKFNNYVTGAFKTEAGFVSHLDKACRKFINENAFTQKSNSSKSSELLARYTDVILKKSNKAQEESQIEEILNDVIILFKYIEEKDVFMNYYSKFLAKRLIYTNYASEDLEGSMITKLKSACGYEYTNKLQRMFNDMAVSKDLLERFLKSVKENKIALGVDFSTLILATGSWPLQPPSTNFTVPRELQPCQDSFEKFYQKQHSGRKLNWLHNLAKGEVKANLPGKIFFFTCTGYQIGILMHFNQNPNPSCKDLELATQMTDQNLHGTIKQLLKAKILLSTPALSGESDAITDTHTFSVNTDFKSKKVKINLTGVGAPAATAGAATSGAEDPEIIEERKILMQAAIVRIMKARRKLKHQQLINEVIDQLKSRFKPSIPLIKKCIDMLIEKEYLERVKGERDMFGYVA